MLQFMSLLALSLIAIGQTVALFRMRSRYSTLKKAHEAILSHRSDYGLGTGPRHWTGEKL